MLAIKMKRDYNCCNTFSECEKWQNMTKNTDSVCRHIAANGRPSWPIWRLELWWMHWCWKEKECEFDIQSNSSAKKQHDDKSHKSYSDEDLQNVFESTHWCDELDDPVEKTVPLYRLLSQFELELNCATLEENKAIFNVVLEIMNKIA